MIASLRERFGRLIHEAAKFGVVGAAGFAITAAGYNLLYYDVRIGSLRLGSFTSYLISVLVATAVTFVGNRFWTFRHRDGRGAGRDSALFFILNGLGMGVQYVPLGVTVHLLGRTDRVSDNVALVIGVAIATLFRFWSYRRWVWGTLSAAAAGGGAGQRAAGPAAPAYAEAAPATRQAGPR